MAQTVPPLNIFLQRIHRAGVLHTPRYAVAVTKTIAFLYFLVVFLSRTSTFHGTLAARGEPSTMVPAGKSS